MRNRRVPIFHLISPRKSTFVKTFRVFGHLRSIVTCIVRRTIPKIPPVTINRPCFRSVRVFSPSNENELQGLESQVGVETNYVDTNGLLLTAAPFRSSFTNRSCISSLQTPQVHRVQARGSSCWNTVQ